jgi:NAD(P)-dependent dehydrogenase (short-subunit alcohol dehydrogenase family)
MFGKPSDTAIRCPTRRPRLSSSLVAVRLIGFEAAKRFARCHTRVVLACSIHERGCDAVERVRARVPDTFVELLRLNLANPDKVHAIVEEFETT